MWYDVVCVAILILSTIRGAAKGFVWQVATIGALVSCFVFASPLSEKMAPHIGLEPPLGRWVSMFLLYAGMSLVCFGAARLLRDWLEKARFVEYDRHLGSLFGLAKGVVLCLLSTFFLVTLVQSSQPTVLRSYGGYASAIILHKLHPVLPDELDRILVPYLQRLEGVQPYDLDVQLGNGTSLDPQSAPTADPFARSGPVPWPMPESGSTTDPRTAPALPGSPYVDGAPRAPFDANPRSGPGAANPAGGPDEWLKRLPSVPDDGLKQTIRRLLEQLTATEQNELLKRLGGASADEMRTVVSDWSFGRPGAGEPPIAPRSDVPPAIEPTIDASRRTELLEEIAAIYADAPESRAAFAENVERQLVGIPDRVALAALEDWYADAITFDADPDPATSLTTPLPDRLLRRLSAAKVPTSSLSEAVRLRLDAGTRR